MATTTEQVRALTGLTVDEVPDSDIDALLAVNDDVVKLAAADALEAFASQLTVIESDDIRIDESKRAAVLIARAARLREQALADAEDEAFSFDVVEAFGCDPAEFAPRRVW